MYKVAAYNLTISNMPVKIHYDFDLPECFLVIVNYAYPHPAAPLGPSPSRGRKNASIPTVSPTLIFLARLGTSKITNITIWPNIIVSKYTSK